MSADEPGSGPKKSLTGPRQRQKGPLSQPQGSPQALPSRVRLGGAAEFVKRPSQAGTTQRIEEMLREMGRAVRSGRVKACLLLALDDDGSVEFATVADAVQFGRLVAEVPTIVDRVSKELVAATKLDRDKGGIQ